MANKHMERRLTIISHKRNKCIKTTVRYHFIPTGIIITAVSNNQRPSNTGVGEDVENLEPSSNVGRNVNCAGGMEDSLRVPRKFKHKVTI